MKEIIPEPIAYIINFGHFWRCGKENECLDKLSKRNLRDISIGYTSADISAQVGDKKISQNQ